VHIGIVPSIRGAEYSYSAGSRAYALIRNISFCSLYKEGVQYDAVLLQKVFDCRLIRRIKAAGAKCIVDTCNFKERTPGETKALLDTDVVTVPTETMRNYIRSKHLVKPIHTAPDVHEYSMDWPLAAPAARTVVVPGTYYNVLRVKGLHSVLEGADKVVIVTNPEKKYQDLAERELRPIFRDQLEIRSWTWDTLASSLMDAAVALVLYRTSEEARYKSCNRTSLALHMGIPVVTEDNPEVRELSVGTGGVFFYDAACGNESIRGAIDKAFVCSGRWATGTHKECVRTYVKECKYGMTAAAETWTGIFQRYFN